MSLPKGGIFIACLGMGFIFFHQSITTDKEENGNAIMAEKRENMDEEVTVKRKEFVEKLHRTRGIELIFVLLHGKS